MPSTALTQNQRRTLREAKFRDNVRLVIKGAVAERGLTLGVLASILGWPESTLSTRLQNGLTMYQFKQIADALSMDEKTMVWCIGGKR